MATKVTTADSKKKVSDFIVPLVILNLIQENTKRNDTIRAKFNPITGEGSIGERVKITIKDFPFAVQYIPRKMMTVPLVRQIVEAGSIKAFFKELTDGKGQFNDEEKEKIIEQFTRIRIRHDFPFWAALYVLIKRKGGGEDVHFRLNRPQRILIERFERRRLQGKPIRLVLLKARQWGGSTCTQMYMAWLQLVHKVGLNSLIVAHVKDTSEEIKDMFNKMLEEYPISMLYEMGDIYDDNEKKLVGVGRSGNISRVPQRNCKIKIGTAEKPNSARGGDYNLVHCSEVGLWKKTDGKSPEDIARSAFGGMLLLPYTMIVLESTANGTGNYYHREYIAAKEGKSQFEALFISWFMIEQYAMPVTKDYLAENNINAPKGASPLEAFAMWLYDHRNSTSVASNREEPGTYLWWLWNQGATLEAIAWYIQERKKYTEHGLMAAEYPSNDIEAFTFSGSHVFHAEDIEQFRSACRPPKMVGEIYGREDTGKNALEKLRFKPESDGKLWVWQDVEYDDDEIVLYRYLVVVDVCKGHTKRADYSVITVFDRLYMMDLDKPTVVAQWYGHIDMDLLSWKAAQIAAYYDNALLVIESNTLETNNTKGDAEYILNIIREVYENLYARKQSAEDIKEKVPLKYGFHTNVATKTVIINNLKTIVREHLYVERDERCLEEMHTYIETEKGGYEAMEGYHDDLLMTRAIGLYICFHEMPVPVVKKRPHATSTRRTKRKAVSAATI